MDDRYKLRGYSTKFHENESGAYMDIRHKGKIIAGITVAICRGGENQPVGIEVDRFEKGVLPLTEHDQSY